MSDFTSLVLQDCTLLQIIIYQSYSYILNIILIQPTESSRQYIIKITNKSFDTICIYLRLKGITNAGRNNGQMRGRVRCCADGAWVTYIFNVCMGNGQTSYSGPEVLCFFTVLFWKAGHCPYNTISSYQTIKKSIADFKLEKNNGTSPVQIYSTYIIFQFVRYFKKTPNIF